jgi:hypothetical protein
LAADLEGLSLNRRGDARHEPLKDYARAPLRPGECKSVEPMAARLDPDRVQAARPSLHMRVAKAPWSDEAGLSDDGLCAAAMESSVRRVVRRAGRAVDREGLLMLPLLKRDADGRSRQRSVGVRTGGYGHETPHNDVRRAVRPGLDF